MTFRPRAFPLLLALALPVVFASSSEPRASSRQLQPPDLGADLVSRKSPHPFDRTLDRLESAVRAAGATVFARIDHAAAATTAGLTLRPTTVLVFGNPKAGTPLMQSAPTFALDLPLRVLVWQDDSGQVWLAWRDPAVTARDHGVADGDLRVATLAGALQRFTDEAVRP